MPFDALGTTFRVHERYRLLQPLGKGSFGIVCAAKDAKTGVRVAIKKLSNVTKGATSAKHALREIRLLRYLGVHPNIVSLFDIKADEERYELYLVMELMDTDLHKIIQSSQSLSDEHTAYFMWQLLCGLEFLHRHGPAELVR